jgi:two-component system, CitB family, sensor kinase
MPAIGSATLRAFFTAKAAHAAVCSVHLTVSETSWLLQKLVAPVKVVTVVDNSLDASHASGFRPASVEIDLGADGGELVPSMVNTGDDIPPERVGHIAIKGVFSRGEGRGLGLAISRRTARGRRRDVELTVPGGHRDQTVFVTGGGRGFF